MKPLPPVTAAGPADMAAGWYLFQLTDGSIALQRVAAGGQSPANMRRSVYIGPAALSLVDLGAQHGTALSNGLAEVGANGTQQQALITQLDVAAGKFPNTARILITKAVKPGTNRGVTATDAKGNPISTTPSGDAADAGINVPTPSAGNLTGIAIRVLEAVGGVLLLVIGLRALLGGGLT